MYTFIFYDKVHEPTTMILVQPQNQIESGLSSGPALYGNKMGNLILFFHRQVYDLVWFWAKRHSAQFLKAFQFLTCKNVRSISGNVEGCGIQHLLFCLLTTDWKYDFCRYQFVVNTFFM